MPQVPRPDQKATPGVPAAPGSRSGAGDVAGALLYPGVPAAVPNCKSAQILHQGVSTPVPFFTFPAAGRIWAVSLSYVITSNPSFTLATARTYAVVTVSPASITLPGAIDLGVAGPKQVTNAQSQLSLPGLPVTAGQSLILSVNGGALVANLDQQASAVVLYSIP